MKKCFCLALVVCMSATLLGCHTAPDIEYEPTSSATTAETSFETMEATAPTEATIAITNQLPLISVSVPKTSQKTYAADGVMIHENIRQNINLTVPDPEVANKIIIDFLQVTDNGDALNDSIDFAKQVYLEHPDSPFPHWYGAYFSPMRHDSAILSMFGLFTDYTGGVHGDYLYASLNYELTSGKKLSLSDILVSDPDMDALCQHVLTGLDEVKNTKVLFDDYQSSVTEHFQRPIAQISNWYLSNDGLCFFFSPYEISPFTSMEIVAQIPYSELIGILNDAYFPSERELASGTVLIQNIDVNALNEFSQFAELTLQGGGAKALLYSDNLVYDFRIEIGTWSYDNSTFTPQYTAFSAYTLTPGDAIVVEYETADNPTVRISYNSNGGTIYRYLSAQDGTAQLTS